MGEDITKLDLYAIIGVPDTATEAEIKKGYRKKALSCHPDKNPDNPKAAELFLQLSKALEILTDVSAKAAYDKCLRAKAEKKIRDGKLDSQRKKFKDDLEAREEAFRKSQSATSTPKSDEEQLRAEIERLRKEGSRLVEQEKERLRQKIAEELARPSSQNWSTPEACRVKIKWRVAKDDETNGGYNYDNLQRFLSKHGDIDGLVVSTAKKGRAMVDFKTRDGAESAINYEKGLITNPLKLEGMINKSKVSQPTFNTTNLTFNKPYNGVSLFPSAGGSANTNKKNVFQNNLSFSSAPDIFNTQNPKTDGDYENMVLENLKRAEERKRLIEQMEAEDKKT